MNRSSLNMNLWELGDWCNTSRGQKGQTTAFWVHGIKSDGEKRNYGTFCLTWPEENYWLLCGSCMVVSGISCSVVIKIQLLVTAGTQMPFWIVCKVRQLFLQPRSCFRIRFSNCFLLHLIPVSLFWMETQEVQNLVAIFCLQGERSPVVRVCGCCIDSHRARKVGKAKSKVRTFLNLSSELCSTNWIFSCEQLQANTFCSRSRASAIFIIFLAGLPVKALLFLADYRSLGHEESPKERESLTRFLVSAPQ